MARWTFDDIPDQSGRTAIVTGANTGIGLETARMLAQKGARVVLACRSPEKGEAAAARINSEAPGAGATFAPLDLSDLGRTKQGFELQFGTNHLGHFALAARLFPLLGRTSGARVVVVSSTAHNLGRIDFDDLNWQRRPYSAWPAYGQSKLANMMFALELRRRLVRAGSELRITAAHPGWTATDLQRTSGVVRFLNPLFAMKPHDGALPTLRAATDPSAESGSYWGPSRFGELNGPPARARISERAKDENVAKRLWEESEKLAKVAFAFPPMANARNLDRGG